MGDEEYAVHSLSGRAGIAARYVDALVTGDRAAATAAVTAGITAGLGLPELLLEVLAPGQREVGARWHRGELAIGHEHWATEVTSAEIARVREAFPPSRDLGVRAVVATPEGERHALAPLCVAALLGWRGWRVDLLGADLPADELARYVAARRPDLVALSATLPESLPALAAASHAVADLQPAPLLLLGGAALGSPPALPAGFPAAAVATDALGGAELAEDLVSSDGPPDLAAYLAVVGRRIQTLRRRRGLSQAGLGEAADLTRSYLSAVERGRQNITLDAALRLAAALRVGVSELLSEDLAAGK